MEKKQSLYAVANRVNKNHEDESNKLYVAVKEKASTYDALAQMIDLLADGVAFENKELAAVIKTELTKKMAEEIKRIRIEK